MTMQSVHMILQGKGGVGKSYAAALLAQHLKAHGIEPVCIDTDPINQTLAGYAGLNVRTLELMAGDDLNPRAFDQLVDWVMGAKSGPVDQVFVIDNGAASFVPLCAWMVENDVAAFFAQSGVPLTLHSVLTGGQALDDTVVGLKNLLKHFPESPVVVWLNEYFGRTERNGVAFADSKLAKAHQEQLGALIRIPSLRKETFGADVDELLRDKRTYAEAAVDESLSIMARQRLAMVWRELDAQMTGAELVNSAPGERFDPAEASAPVSSSTTGGGKPPTQRSKGKASR